MNQLIVSAAIIFGNKLLAAQRAYPENLKEKWELPGGKVESHEDCKTALAREIREELGHELSIEQIGPALINPNNKDGLWPLANGLFMTTYLVKLTGAPIIKKTSAHLDLKWVGDDEILELDWIAADLPIIKTLRKYLV